MEFELVSTPTKRRRSFFQRIVAKVDRKFLDRLVLPCFWKLPKNQLPGPVVKETVEAFRMSDRSRVLHSYETYEDDLQVSFLSRCIECGYWALCSAGGKKQRSNELVLPEYVKTGPILTDKSIAVTEWQYVTAEARCSRGCHTPATGNNLSKKLVNLINVQKLKYSLVDTVRLLPIQELKC